MKLLIAGLVCLTILVFATAASGDDPPAPAPEKVIYVESTYQGKTVDWWATRAVRARKDANARGLTIRRLKRSWRPGVDYSIAIAAFVYGVSERDMHHVASCESGHNPAATNGQYRGLFQEGPMFERSPFSRFGSVFDPLLNALTAAYTVSRDGWSQWECKP